MIPQEELMYLVMLFMFSFILLFYLFYYLWKFPMVCNKSLKLLNRTLLLLIIKEIQQLNLKKEKRKEGFTVNDSMTG